MPEIFGVPAPVLYGQLLLGLVNGSFYALLSLGLSLIFGLLNIVNFAHGTMYMLGAFLAYLLLNPLGLGYWWAIVLVPLMAAGIGIVVERTILRRMSLGLDPSSSGCLRRCLLCLTRSLTQRLTD